MKIYTRQGDDGTTSDLRGQRVRKDSPSVTACGEIDELSAAIGLARAIAAQPGSQKLHDQLLEIQKKLISMAATVSDPAWAANLHPKEDIDAIEKLIDEYSAKNGPMKTFMIPGDNDLSARLNLARTVCRRVERAMVTLAESQQEIQPVLAWFNRLGDLLFEMARNA